MVAMSTLFMDLSLLFGLRFVLFCLPVLCWSKLLEFLTAVTTLIYPAIDVLFSCQRFIIFLPKTLLKEPVSKTYFRGNSCCLSTVCFLIGACLVSSAPVNTDLAQHAISNVDAISSSHL